MRPTRYIPAMTAPKHDWYLRDWLKVLKKRQTDIVADLDWNKAKVSLMLSGKQQYTRDAVNELAEYLNLHPFELLMHPADAMRLRSLRENAIQVVANTAPLAAANDDRTGTNG